MTLSGTRSSACRRTPRPARRSRRSALSLELLEQLALLLGQLPRDDARSRARAGRPARSPAAPACPRPRRTRTSPGCVPGSNSSSRLALERRHRDTVAPSAACGHRQVDRRRRCRCPRARSARRGRTWTARRRRRRAPPACPHGPRREMRMCCPSWIPGGIVDLERPLLDRRGRRPSHSVAGVLDHPSGAVAASGRSACRTNSPKIAARDLLHAARCRRRSGHVRPACPARRRSPPHRSHGTATLERHLALAPRRAPRRARSRSARATSAPARRGLRARPTPKRSSPKNAEKRSERLPKSKRGRLEAAAAQPRMAETVVELARAREFESTSYASTTSLKRSSASGASETSGMELAREPAERLLDLGLGRVREHAEQLVVVALRRRHRRRRPQLSS